MINIKTATELEVFTYVKNHLLKQGRKSVIHGTFCQYRGDNGGKCAAGCLIPDAEYDPAIEGKIWTELVNFDEVPSNHCKLIRKLQIIHDQYDTEDWYERLTKLENELKDKLAIN